MKPESKPFALRRQVASLVDLTADAYAVKLYASWPAVIRALLIEGYTGRAVEAIVRSKIARWAADTSSARYGRATAKDFLRFIKSQPNHVTDVLREEGL